MTKSPCHVLDLCHGTYGGCKEVSLAEIGLGNSACCLIIICLSIRLSNLSLGEYSVGIISLLAPDSLLLTGTIVMDGLYLLPLAKIYGFTEEEAKKFLNKSASKNVKLAKPWFVRIFSMT